MLGGYLSQLRSDVHSISPLTLESFDSLLDIGKRDPLIVFDYRRYQTDVVEFARHAEARGAHVVWFTYPWMSPIAQIAHSGIIAESEERRIGKEWDSPFRIRGL